MELKLEDQRHFFRIRLQAPLHYQIRGKPNFNNTVTENISIGGLSFTNDKFIAPNTLLTLQVNVLSKILNPIARVAWVNSLPYNDRYRLGVEFIELDPTQKRYLADYINMRRDNF